MNVNPDRLFRRWPALLGTLVLLVVGATAVPAQELGSCVSVEVLSSVVFPDGSVHPAGSLEICVERLHSPVTRLHEMRVNGKSVGLYRSLRVDNELQARETTPFLLFQRNRSGELVLQGYAMPDGERVRTYRMTTSSARPSLSARSR